MTAESLPENVRALEEAVQSSGADECQPPATWPVLDAQALGGLAGEIVRTIAPCTEADPAAILFQLLAAVGCAMGRKPHVAVEASRHGMNEFIVVVGSTSRSRKGTSWDHVKRIINEVDDEFHAGHILSGLSSGEGLISAIRDPEPDDDGGGMSTAGGGRIGVHGDADLGRRLLVMEPEFVRVLQMSGRTGNILSTVLREAWDGGPLRTMTRREPLQATGHHVGVIAHITEDELARALPTVELFNGFANRFLWVCARRQRLLPEGGEVPESRLSPLLNRLEMALGRAKGVVRVEFDAEARELWRGAYPGLTQETPGTFGAATSRAEAHVRRLAAITALLDDSERVCRQHLLTAIAIWDYSEDSAKYLFGDQMGDPIADKVLEVLAEAGGELSLREIHRACGGHLVSVRLKKALKTLQGLNRVDVITEKTGGRPKTVVRLRHRDTASGANDG